MAQFIHWSELEIKFSRRTVVLDRYAYSGVAYSLAKGTEELSLEWCKEADSGLPRPDLVFFLDVDVSVTAKRANYGQERYERSEFQKKVREAFQKLVEENWVSLDGSDSIKTIQSEIEIHTKQTIQQCARQPIRFLWPENSSKE